MKNVGHLLESAHPDVDLEVARFLSRLPSERRDVIELNANDPVPDWGR